MLIKCPECGKEISDKSKMCIGCGFPLSDVPEEKKLSSPNKPHIICPSCGGANDVGSRLCVRCGYRYKRSDCNIVWPVEEINENTDGIYRKIPNGGFYKVCCPRCKSSNCSHYKKQTIIPGKTKTSYTMNLNPFRPFTILNKKEKVVKSEQLKTENKIICNVCGTIF